MIKKIKKKLKYFFSKKDFLQNEFLIEKKDMKDLLKLVKNKNFLNNQNYVFSKNIIQRSKRAIISESSWENLIWFDDTKIIQEIKKSNISQEISANNGVILWTLWPSIIFLWMMLINPAFLFAFILWSPMFMVWINEIFKNYTKIDAKFYENKNKIIILRKTEK